MKPKIPDVLFEYWELVQFMMETPGMYGLDSRRMDLHDKLCDAYNLDHDETKEITGSLDKFKNPEEFHKALIDFGGVLST